MTHPTYTVTRQATNQRVLDLACGEPVGDLDGTQVWGAWQDETHHWAADLELHFPRSARACTRTRLWLIRLHRRALVSHLPRHTPPRRTPRPALPHLRRDRGAAVTEHVLASIDGALDDWETSDDAMRWKPKTSTSTAMPDIQAVTHPPREALREVLRPLAEYVKDNWQQITDAVMSVQQAQADDQIIPDDPRDRALWLHQHRNVGPSRQPFKHRGGR